MIEFPVKKINGGTIKHEVIYFDENNMGVDNLDVRLSVRNTVNNYYYDFLTNSFNDSPSIKYKNFTYLDGGVYFVNLSLSNQFSEDIIYSFEADPQNNSFPKLIEIYRFNSLLEENTLIDGVELHTILEYMMSMYNGNYTFSLTGDNLITFFKRNNITPLSIVEVNTNSRRRQM